METKTKEKIYCHDCQKEMIFEGKKIKNGKMLVYESQGEKNHNI
jgi:hypothetical protein